MADETERIQSIDSLAERQDRTESKLDQLLGMVGKLTGADKTPAPAGESSEESGRPGDISAQVRAELARAEEEKAKAKAAEDDKAQQETLAQRLAKLEEKAPEPPQPRRQRAMWGSR